MYLLQKIKDNRYISIILILTICYIISNTSFHILSGINYAVIIFVLISNNIDEKTYIPYSIIFGLYSDFVLHSFIGFGTLFFMAVSLTKMFSEHKFDSKTQIGKVTVGFLSIVAYNFFAAILLHFNLILSFPFIIKTILFDFILYLIIFLIMEFNSAFRVVKR